jgi:hypothetical protein
MVESIGNTEKPRWGVRRMFTKLQFQFRLRHLFIVVTLAGLVTPWAIGMHQSYAKQRKIALQERALVRLKELSHGFETYYSGPNNRRVSMCIAIEPIMSPRLWEEISKNVEHAPFLESIKVHCESESHYRDFNNFAQNLPPKIFAKLDIHAKGQCNSDCFYCTCHLRGLQSNPAERPSLPVEESELSNENDPLAIPIPSIP